MGQRPVLLLGYFHMGAFGSCVLYRKRFQPDVILRNQLGFHDSSPGDLGRFVGAAFSRNSQLFDMRLFFAASIALLLRKLLGFNKTRNTAMEIPMRGTEVIQAEK